MTIPIKVPLPSTTGSRLIPVSVIRRAAEETCAPRPIVIAGDVIASPAVRADSFVGVGARPPASSQPTMRPCRGPGPCSLRRMSASETTPSTWSRSPTTGSPEMRCSASIAATSRNGVSGPTVITFSLISFSIFMSTTSLVAPRIRAPALHRIARDPDSTCGELRQRVPRRPGARERGRRSDGSPH